MSSCSPTVRLARCRRLASAGHRMSLTSELLPEPDTPVMQTKRPSGIGSVRSLRLFCRAPRTTSQPFCCGDRVGCDGMRPARRGGGSFVLCTGPASTHGATGRRLDGIGIAVAPLRYARVSDGTGSSVAGASTSGETPVATAAGGAFCRNSAGAPSATMRPPAAPARGPKSSKRSACRITSRSCSTISSVLPRSRSLASARISRNVSRGCRPMVGSSRTYSTPERPLPIWLARRMRCASPPESVGAARCNVR
jgi:hypothetical protein